MRSVPIPSGYFRLMRALPNPQYGLLGTILADSISDDHVAQWIVIDQDEWAGFTSGMPDLVNASPVDADARKLNAALADLARRGFIRVDWLERKVIPIVENIQRAGEVELAKFQKEFGGES